MRKKEKKCFSGYAKYIPEFYFYSLFIGSGFVSTWTKG